MNRTITLLPPNESAFLKAKELAYRSVINNNSSALVLDPMSCDEKLLAHLAQVVQVLFWSKELTVAEKRKLILETKELHKFLGTPYAIKKVFAILELDANLVEWFEGQLNPYHFNVEVDVYTRGISAELMLLLEQMIETYKNVRSELDTIEVRLNSKAKLKIAMATMGGETVTLQPYQLDLLSFNVLVSTVMTTYSAEITTLYPKEVN
jgi:phage tail P2-like protein